MVKGPILLSKWVFKVIRFLGVFKLGLRGLMAENEVQLSRDISRPLKRMNARGSGRPKVLSVYFLTVCCGLAD